MRGNKIIKTCPICHVTFTVNKKNAAKIYCSKQCQMGGRHTGETRICIHCGKPFYRPKSRIARNEKYCSSKCYYTALSAARITKICPQCGREFTVKASEADRYTVCSRKCRTVNTKYVICKRCGKVFRAEPDLNRQYCSETCRRPPQYVTCRKCGKVFREVPSMAQTRQFCSFSCYRSFYGETVPEKRVRESLISLDIHFIPEAPVSRYSIDFLLPDLNVALEVDGIYWHRDPRKDERKAIFLQGFGLSVCRISEIEITDNPDLPSLLIQKLSPFLKSSLCPLQPPLFHL
ncbi:MAG: DUF559 domain-containing protein [Chloroflexi bacterium]|nr:DUF559 domain-containing protein [Chloroflexota bacterium]